MASATLRQPLLERVSWGALFAGFFVREETIPQTPPLTPAPHRV